MVGNKRVISFILSAAMLISSVCLASASDIDSMEDKQYELELQNDRYESIIEETKGDIARQQEYMDAIMKKIETINEQIYISNKKISDINDQINELQEQISEAKKQIEDTLDLLRERIKAIYLAGEASSLELILGAADFTDFMDKVDLVQSISDFDSRLIKELEGKMTKINAQRKEIEKKRSEADAELEKQNKKKAELQQLQDENQAAIDKLNEQLEEQESLVAENNWALAQINEDIENYYAEQRRLEEEKNNQQNNTPDNDDNYIGSNITSDGSYVWPTPGFYYLTSEWNEDRGSYNHGAIDIAGGGIWGTPVIAAQSGTVTFVSDYCTHDYGKYWSCGCGGGYGNYVMIDHGNGYSTLYGHLSDVTVWQGQNVSQGETIGHVGSTGESTGPHLHFETRLWGVKYNPMSEY